MSPPNGNDSNPDFRLLSINPPLLSSPLCMRVHVVLKDSDCGIVGGALSAGGQMLAGHEDKNKPDSPGQHFYHAAAEF